MASYQLKKIGIFLAFAPEQSIKSHGIGRLLCFLISAAKGSIKFTLAIPSWYQPEILELLHDHKIQPDCYELLIHKRQPYLLLIKAFLQKFSTPKSKKNKLKQMVGKTLKLVKKMAYWLIHTLTSTSLILFTMGLVFSLSIGLAFIYFLFFIPLFLLISSLFAFFIIRLWRSSIGSSIKAKLMSHPYGSKFYRQTQQYLCWFKQPIQHFKHNRFTQKIYAAMYAQEIRKLIQLVNAQKNIETWFIPTLFWPEINAIKAIKIVAAPDIVFLDFPYLFTQKTYYQAYKNITATLHAADHLICYSEHVKQQQLIEKSQIDAQKITVIPHGPTSLLHYFDNDSTQSMTKQALKIIKQYQQECLYDDKYLSDFDFTNTRFIFYASQLRPHKNFLNLFKAYEILLRQRYLGIKLIVTANLQSTPEISGFITENKLQYDILSLYDIPSEMLAALNHLAICAVNPTLFEGGFPFTFSEAYSVGTPSVMSRIPVVESVIDIPPLQNRMLFDPYRIDDMVEKIAWGITHQDELYQAQRSLYEKLALRSWQNVAEEYMHVFYTV